MNYRSQLEERVAKKLDGGCVPYLYEASKYDYTLTSNYTPDFFLPNDVILEVKGFFKPSDRRKMLAIKQQHPDLDIRFVFQAPYNKIYKGSRTTYAKWAEKHGFPWTHFRSIPNV